MPNKLFALPLALCLLASPALSQFGNATRIQNNPVKPGMTCSDAYVLTWVSAHGQFECLAASGAPTGAAGGVLGGTYPSPTFAGGASFNANAATFLNGAGSFTSPGTANARITFSNVASATMTLTGVAVKAVVTCWDSSVSPARLFIPDSVEQTDADTLTFNFSPNATGYCDGSTGIGLTGATGPTGPAGGVTSVFGSTGVITTLANPTFTGTMLVGPTLLRASDGALLSTDISTPSNPSAGTTLFYAKGGKWCSLSPAGAENCTGAGAPAFSAITGATNSSAAMVIGTGASMDVSGSGTNNATSLGGSAAALYAKLASPAFTTPSLGVATATSLAATSIIGNNDSGGTLLTLPTNTGLYHFGANGRITSGGIANPGFFSSARWDGTVGSPTAVQSGEQIGGYNSWAYDGSTLIGPLGSFRCFANQTQSVGAGGTYCEVATTPNGSTTIASAMRWQATGGVTLPSTVTGGDKGAGTFNATGLYQANVQVATLSGTEALTNKTYNGITFTQTGTPTVAFGAGGTAAYTTGSPTSGDAASWDASGRVIDAGYPATAGPQQQVTKGSLLVAGPSSATAGLFMWGGAASSVAVSTAGGYQPFPVAGRIRNPYAVTSTAQGSGTYSCFGILQGFPLVNTTGLNTNSSFCIVPSAVSGGYGPGWSSDYWHVAQGGTAYFTFGKNGAGTTSATVQDGSAEFVADNGSYVTLLFVADNGHSPTASTTNYWPMIGSGQVFSTANTDVLLYAIPMPFAGTLANLQVTSRTTPANNAPFTVQKIATGGSSAADTSLTVTVLAADTTPTSYIDNTHTDTAVAGDAYLMKVVAGASTQMGLASMGVAYTASSGTKTAVFSVVGGTQTASTKYYGLMTALSSQTTAATADVVMPFACSATNLYAFVDTQNGGGVTSAITLEQNDADTTLTGTITSGTAIGSALLDNSHTVSLAAGDKVAIKVVVAGGTSGKIGGISFQCN